MLLVDRKHKNLESILLSCYKDFFNDLTRNLRLRQIKLHGSFANKLVGEDFLIKEEMSERYKLILA